MASANQFDEHLWAVLYQKYSRAGGRSERSQIVTEMAEHFGVHRKTIYERIRKYKNTPANDATIFKNQSPGSAKRRTRKDGTPREIREQVARTISKYKETSRVGRKGYVMPTRRAIEIALKMEDLPPEFSDLDRSTADRWLREFGLANHDFKKESIAVGLKAEFAGHWYMVDASPLNRYYMRTDGEIHRRNYEPNDKKLDVMLERDGYQKIQVYCATDVFSTTYFFWATPGRGESAADWLKFMRMLFLPKENYPMEGAPHNIYSDMGSGLTAHDFQNMLSRMQIGFDTHLPGHPRAKGRVEGRISAMKRDGETVLTLLGDRLNSVEQLNRYLLSFSRAHCHETGKFDRFLQSAKQVPIRRVSQRAWHNCTIKHRERTTDVYGCVSVAWSSKDKASYRVRGADPRTKVLIYRNLEDQVIAQEPVSGRIFECDPAGKLERMMGSYRTVDSRSIPLNIEEIRRRKEVQEESRKVKSYISESALLPDETNIHYLPASGDEVTVPDRVLIPNDSFESADDAKLYIYTQSDLSADELTEDVRDTIDQILNGFTALGKGIPVSIAREAIQIIQEERARSKDAQ